MKANGKELKCFVSAAAGTDLTPLLNLLRERRIGVPDLAVLNPRAITLAEKVLDAIRSADLTIAVLGEGPASHNVLFEVGIAYALRKRILMIAPEGFDIPSDMLGLLYVRAAPDNREAVSFALDQMPLAQPGGRTRKELPRVKSLGDASDELLRWLNQLGEDPPEAEVEAIVREMFKASGILTFAEQKQHGSRPDFAIWVDELEPYTGNPLPVEVKSRLDSPSQTSRLEAEISRYLEQSDVRTVLVFASRVGPKVWETVSRHPQIYLFSLPELLGRLKDRSLAQIIRDERNARVHGRFA